MSFEYVNTGHLPLAYRLNNLEVFFSDERCLKIIQTVLDENGQIKQFPGITEDEQWTSKQRVGICPDVRYEAQFYFLDDNTYLMLWLVQPSGWYWVDEDGFGFSGDSSITLYSLVDKEGNFARKFELFSIDQTRYCHKYDDILRF